ncbi:MAG: hypothetical protein ABR559_09575 [Gemmatimonadota bacterium]
MAGRRLWLAALLVLVACGGDSGSGPEDDPDVPRRQLIRRASGGVLSSSNGAARVTVPANALPADVELEVERLRPEEIPALLNLQGVIGRAWRFGPNGQRFNTKVRISLAYDTDAFPSGVDISRITLVTVGLDGKLEILEDIRLETGLSPADGLRPAAGGRLDGLISHFSPFAVIVKPAD